MTQIRIARASDAGDILAIYAPYILHTSITFETEVPDPASFAARITSYLQSWPWLVAESGGRIMGYAYASRYRERSGYQWSVECSVYIHDEFLRRGLAGKLYQALFSLLQQQGYRNVYAVINLPNDRSVSFHEARGFRWFANYEQVGYKLGQWKTVGWWRLILNEFGPDPAPPLPFRVLDIRQVEAVLDQFSEGKAKGDGHPDTR